MDGIKKLWGKEGYLPKKESGAADKLEAAHAPAESATMENVDQAMTRKDQAQGHTPSTEEKEKQLLASSLFVGLGPENTINLVSCLLHSCKNPCALCWNQELDFIDAWWEMPSIAPTASSSSPRATTNMVAYHEGTCPVPLSKCFSQVQSARGRPRTHINQQE